MGKHVTNGALSASYEARKEAPMDCRKLSGIVGISQICRYGSDRRTNVACAVLWDGPRIGGTLIHNYTSVLRRNRACFAVFRMVKVIVIVGKLS